jgi:hypothetical protein
VAEFFIFLVVALVLAHARCNRPEKTISISHDILDSEICCLVAALLKNIAVVDVAGFYLMHGGRVALLQLTRGLRTLVAVVVGCDVPCLLRLSSYMLLLLLLLVLY